jgi:coniferyl-aldehyde dehydrogenase
MTKSASAAAARRFSMMAHGVNRSLRLSTAKSWAIGAPSRAAQAFTALPFNHIVFTGSPQVGRQVMRAAADNLTPVTLELGGKSPAIVGPEADLRDAALRIAHGKVFNAGQICVAPDYALVPRGQAVAFAAAVVDAFDRLNPAIGGNAEYTSIITERHATRLRDLLDDAAAQGAKVMRCGTDAGTRRQMPLHVVTGVHDGMRVMREEIFGPILPVVEYDRLDDALALVKKGERPLSLYGFGLNRDEHDQYLSASKASSHRRGRRRGRTPSASGHRHATDFLRGPNIHARTPLPYCQCRSASRR